MQSKQEENAMMENAMVEKWELWDYFDVNGNENDGWEINDQTRVRDDIVIFDGAVNDDIVRYLVEQEYLQSEAKVDDFYILWESDFVEVYDKQNGKPLFYFRKQDC